MPLYRSDLRSRGSVGTLSVDHIIERCKGRRDGLIVLSYDSTLGVHPELLPASLQVEFPQFLDEWSRYLQNVKEDTRVFVRDVSDFPLEQLAHLRDAIQVTSRNSEVFWILEVSVLSLAREDLAWLKDALDCSELPEPQLLPLKPVPSLIPSLVPSLLRRPNPLRLLHLSDLHLTQQRKANQFYSQLAEDLLGGGVNVQQLDYLVVSGDVVVKSTGAEYRVALDFFEQLVKGFGLRRDHIILVPGNHDFNWELSDDAYDRFISNSRLTSPLPANYIREANGIRVRDDAKWLKRFDHFQNFYHSLCGKSYPLEHDQQGVIYKFPDDRLVFLGLNSAWNLGHEVNDKVLGKSSINAASLGGLSELMMDKYQDWLKVAVWHHPIRGEEAMNTAFVERLCRAGFQICMSGHIHEAITGFHNYDEVRKMIEIGAGTFGAITHQVPGIPLQYNVLKLDRDTCTLRVVTRKREHEDGAWEADARWNDRDRDPKWYYDRKVTWGRCKTMSMADTSVTHPEQTTASDASSPVASAPPSILPSVKKITILFMAANPSSTVRLRLDEEVRTIDEGLRRASQRDRFVLEKTFATRTKDIIDAILRYKPDIVHFSGHGNSNGDLVFEDESGQAKPVNAAALGQLFKTNEQVRCVVLNACWSDIRADLIVGSVDCVIGTTHSIDDTAAISFASGFYRSLGEGLNVKKAFGYGRAQIDLDGVVENTDKFHLKARPGIDPANIAF